MAMATAPASIVHSSLFSLKTSTANLYSYNNTIPCLRVQVGLRSYRGLSCNVHFRTIFYPQSWKKLQQSHGRIHGGISIRATAEVASDAPPAPPAEISKQKIRIKLKSYWVPRIEQSAKLILDSAKSTGAKALGPIPLPTKRRIYCVLKSPHVHKDAREHFQKKTHQRLIDIENPNAQTIDALMGLDIPEGVDVEVKLK